MKPCREMYYNDDAIVDIKPIFPQGTNSTMFTACCGVAICDDEDKCRRCERWVVGRGEPRSVKGRIRWENATRHWKRKEAEKP